MKKILVCALLSLSLPLFSEEGPAPSVTEIIDPPFPPYQSTVLRMMLTLLALIVLIILSVYLLKRLAQGRMRQFNYSKNIKILERRPLSAKSILYFVEIEGKKVVIGESQLELKTITTLPDTLREEE